MAASKLVLALALRLASAALDWVSHPVAASDWVMLSGDLRAATGKGVTLTSRRDASKTFRAAVEDLTENALKFQMPADLGGDAVEGRHRRADRSTSRTSFLKNFMTADDALGSRVLLGRRALPRKGCSQPK